MNKEWFVNVPVTMLHGQGVEYWDPITDQLVRRVPLGTMSLAKAKLEESRLVAELKAARPIKANHE